MVYSAKQSPCQARCIYQLRLVLQGIEAAQHLLQSSFQAIGANATFSVLSLARADGESIQDQVYKSLATAAAAATKTQR